MLDKDRIRSAKRYQVTGHLFKTSINIQFSIKLFAFSCLVCAVNLYFAQKLLEVAIELQKVALNAEG